MLLLVTSAVNVKSLLTYPHSVEFASSKIPNSPSGPPTKAVSNPPEEVFSEVSVEVFSEIISGVVSGTIDNALSELTTSLTTPPVIISLLFIKTEASSVRNDTKGMAEIITARAKTSQTATSSSPLSALFLFLGIQLLNLLFQ